VVLKRSADAAQQFPHDFTNRNLRIVNAFLNSVVRRVNNLGFLADGRFIVATCFVSCSDANVNAKTEETQETALTLACCGGFLECAELLVKAGADLETGCSTPLMEAAQEGQLELVKFLLQQGNSSGADRGGSVCFAA